MAINEQDTPNLEGFKEAVNIEDIQTPELKGFKAPVNLDKLNNAISPKVSKSADVESEFIGESVEMPWDKEQEIAPEIESSLIVPKDIIVTPKKKESTPSLDSHMARPIKDEDAISTWDRISLAVGRGATYVVENLASPIEGIVGNPEYLEPSSNAVEESFGEIREALTPDDESTRVDYYNKFKDNFNNMSNGERLMASSLLGVSNALTLNTPEATIEVLKEHYKENPEYMWTYQGSAMAGDLALTVTPVGVVSKIGKGASLVKKALPFASFAAWSATRSGVQGYTSSSGVKDMLHDKFINPVTFGLDEKEATKSEKESLQINPVGNAVKYAAIDLGLNLAFGVGADLITSKVLDKMYHTATTDGLKWFPSDKFTFGMTSGLSNVAQVKTQEELINMGSPESMQTSTPFGMYILSFAMGAYAGHANMGRANDLKDPAYRKSYIEQNKDKLLDSLSLKEITDEVSDDIANHIDKLLANSVNDSFEAESLVSNGVNLLDRPIYQQVTGVMKQDIYGNVSAAKDTTPLHELIENRNKTLFDELVGELEVIQSQKIDMEADASTVVDKYFAMVDNISSAETEMIREVASIRSKELGALANSKINKIKELDLQTEFIKSKVAGREDELLYSIPAEMEPILNKIASKRNYLYKETENYLNTLPKDDMKVTTLKAVLEEPSSLYKEAVASVFKDYGIDMIYGNEAGLPAIEHLYNTIKVADAVIPEITNVNSNFSTFAESIVGETIGTNISKTNDFLDTLVNSSVTNPQKIATKFAANMFSNIQEIENVAIGAAVRSSSSLPKVDLFKAREFLDTMSNLAKDPANLDKNFVVKEEVQLREASRIGLSKDESVMTLLLSKILAKEAGEMPYYFPSSVNEKGKLKIAEIEGIGVVSDYDLTVDSNKAKKIREYAANELDYSYRLSPSEELNRHYEGFVLRNVNEKAEEAIARIQFAAFGKVKTFETMATDLTKAESSIKILRKTNDVYTKLPTNAKAAVEEIIDVYKNKTGSNEYKFEKIDLLLTKLNTIDSKILDKLPEDLSVALKEFKTSKSFRPLEIMTPHEIETKLRVTNYKYQYEKAIYNLWDLHRRTNTPIKNLDGSLISKVDKIIGQSASSIGTNIFLNTLKIPTLVRNAMQPVNQGKFFIPVTEFAKSVPTFMGSVVTSLTGMRSVLKPTREGFDYSPETALKDYTKSVELIASLKDKTLKVFDFDAPNVAAAKDYVSAIKRYFDRSVKTLESNFYGDLSSETSGRVIKSELLKTDFENKNIVMKSLDLAGALSKAGQNATDVSSRIWMFNTAYNFSNRIMSNKLKQIKAIETLEDTNTYGSTVDRLVSEASNDMELYKLPEYSRETVKFQLKQALNEKALGNPEISKQYMKSAIDIYSKEIIDSTLFHYNKYNQYLLRSKLKEGGYTPAAIDRFLSWPINSVKNARAVVFNETQRMLAERKFTRSFKLMLGSTAVWLIDKLALSDDQENKMKELPVMSKYVRPTIASNVPGLDFGASIIDRAESPFGIPGSFIGALAGTAEVGAEITKSMISNEYVGDWRNILKEAEADRSRSYSTDLLQFSAGKKTTKNLLADANVLKGLEKAATYFATGYDDSSENFTEEWGYVMDIVIDLLNKTTNSPLKEELVEAKRTLYKEALKEQDELKTKAGDKSLKDVIREKKLEEYKKLQKAKRKVERGG